MHANVNNDDVVHYCVKRHSRGPYSLTWIKLSEKSAQDQIRIKENGSADLWLKSVFTKEGSAKNL